ncbi:DUF6950 family protein [Kushneria phosphatilytica]|nr:hypothetical protein [Kushneria phosphatilytica]
MNWPQKLYDAIQAAHEAAFSWGENDCCTFAADCCIAVCGIDPAEKYRGHYTTEIGAKRKLTEIHGSLEKACDAYFERVPVTKAQRGDMVMFEGEIGNTMGVVWAGSVFSITQNGVRRVKATPELAWRVEDG